MAPICRLIPPQFCISIWFGNAANIEKLIGSAAFCVNDVLDAAGMPKINEPWANQHFVTKNFETLDGAMHRIDGKGGE